MIVIILAAAIGLTMIVLSVRANSRFRQEQKLPMQWMLSRSRPLSSTVIWYAPRILALSLVPALAIFVLTLFAIGSITLTPRPGQEGMLIPSLIFIGGIFLAVQILHLWLIAKTLRGGE
ncbi:hypothetical protein V474_23000 [Novosphingobium barchaimii LL02]|uniref:Uncharacterized protein n=1 Tax=Novosphingobium barchaimii LL02 TaxID=1114963 RepID=A0A0J7XR80_9SPHN|nr:hypothetical protein [Novosphingobium barchaimii]KMS53548.1 hypothetical protein V474_23000 [Novosphingobium barchaimii LL02]